MKLTAIITTATAPLETLAWAVCSLILRTPSDVLHEIIVSINGADSRTGDTTLQDDKQRFLETLSNAGFPIKVVRTWSRLGFSQPYEMCLPLCTTEFVLLMHDDVIVLKQNWHEYIDEKASITTVSPKLGGKLLANVKELESRTMRMDFPHINTEFSVINCKKVSSKLTSYFLYLDKPQNSKNWNELRKFFFHHQDAVSVMPDEHIRTNIKNKCKMESFDDCYSYNLITFPMGAWICYDYLLNRIKISTFPNYTIEHLGAMSWKEGSFEEIKEPMPQALNLINDIKQSTLNNYYKSVDYDIPNIDQIKPLVGVITYDRLKTIDYWLRAWNKAEHYGGQLLVVHNYDGILSKQERENIQKHNPNFYIPRRNIGRDIGALRDVISERIPVSYDWNVLVWFTDDIIPMRKDFLLPLLREISKPTVGLVGGWMDGNIRTVCFAIKRDLAKRINFLDDPFEMERGSYNISNQIKNMGFQVKLPTHSYSPKYAWDCDYEGIVDMWDKYESQF